jgi:carbamoyl-phosphate synthase small subunit
MNDFSNIKKPKNATAVIIMDDRTVLWGRGYGIQGHAIGEICFNTSMSGYQEVITDPSYAGQIITFTFPHIGNVGCNENDIETTRPAAKGIIIRDDITYPSNWRATESLDEWLLQNELIAVSGVDTRALTTKIRDKGAPSGIICHNENGSFDLEELYNELDKWPGLEGMDLAREVTCESLYSWDEKRWSFQDGCYGEQTDPRYHVVAIDYGAKYNILRCLAENKCKVTVVPANTPASEIIALNPDGIFLSNGPGDPAATGKYAIPIVQDLIAHGKPIFGICLGHQILALALGAKTKKMALGHRGSNHPVKDLETGTVEITSQNHGFEVIESTLPNNVIPTHKSLFDGSNEGIALKDKPVFSVQYHPEASPGPQDSYYLFDRFIENIQKSS